MKLSLLLISRLRMGYASFSELLARRWHKRFYLYLAALFTLLALADTAFLVAAQSMRDVIATEMVKQRQPTRVMIDTPSNEWE